MNNDKNRHKYNKKRNTGFLYECLIHEYTKDILNEGEDSKRAGGILKVVQRFFAPGTVLGKELALYEQLVGCKTKNRVIIEKVILMAKDAYSKLDEKEIYESQSKLISIINKRIGSSAMNNYIPNYKRLASISKVFSSKIGMHMKAILEEQIVVGVLNEVNIVEGKKDIQNKALVEQLAIKNFNETYSDLHEEQKIILKHFVNGINSLESKIFLSEEIRRMKKILTESTQCCDSIECDMQMREKTMFVLETLKEFAKKPIEAPEISFIMKTQELIREIDSDE